MPPPAPNLSDAKVMEFFRGLAAGTYTLAITPAFDAFLTPEGATYFAVADKTFVVWKQGCPHDWVDTGTDLRGNTAAANINAQTLYKPILKCRLCGDQMGETAQSVGALSVRLTR